MDSCLGVFPLNTVNKSFLWIFIVKNGQIWRTISVFIYSNPRALKGRECSARDFTIISLIFLEKIELQSKKATRVAESGVSWFSSSPRELTKVQGPLTIPESALNIKRVNREPSRGEGSGLSPPKTTPADPDSYPSIESFHCSPPTNRIQRIKKWKVEWISAPIIHPRSPYPPPSWGITLRVNTVQWGHLLESKKQIGQKIKIYKFWPFDLSLRPALCSPPLLALK